jgi:hypothetical protein
MTYPSLLDCINFLSTPSSFAQPTTSVEIIQTHISVVAMTNLYVYKLKKPVLFDFLDFSTLEKRLYFCEEEVRLNRRLSPELYVALLPLYAEEDQLSFEPGGKLVDYVIQMHRLPNEGMLINQIKNPDFSLDTLDRVAAKLLTFYQNLLENSEPNSFGDANHLRHTIEEIFHGFELPSSPEISASVTALLQECLLDFLDAHKELIKKRVQTGRIVEGHGDLRSEHIHIHNGEINIYDCLEFDKKLRSVDWLNDVAFLLMDLDYRHRHDLTQRLEATWLNALETEDVSSLLTFYKTYRACVRAKVNALKLSEEEVPLAVREESQRKAYRYYQLALRYALLGSQPTVVVCMGGVGSGKSTLAHTLASWLNLTHLNSDVIRKQQAGLSPFIRLEGTHRTELYNAETTERVYTTMIKLADQETQARGAVVLDATYRNAEHLQSLNDYCQQNALRLLVLHTTAPEEIVRQRLKARESELAVSDMRISDYDPASFGIKYDTSKVVSRVAHVSTEASVEVLVLDTVMPWLRQQV